jgi:hypothetical protein
MARENGGGMETLVLRPEATDVHTTAASRRALHILQDCADFIIKP